MSQIYRAILASRKDMTEWLIHSTHQTYSSHPATTLAKILCEGVLRPGFGYRGNPAKATIYGPDPAVCFSEQPLDAFVSYLVARGDPEAMAGYGVLVHKHDVFVAGGLPVIYGVSGIRELRLGDSAYDSNRRILHPDALPLSEQYRYVAFAPTRTPYPVDWTHEREWRWPASAAHGQQNGLYYLAGPYFKSQDSFQARLVAFVSLDHEIDWLRQTVAGSLAGFAGSVAWGWPPSYFDVLSVALQSVPVLSLETVRRELAAGNSNYRRLEDIPVSTLKRVV